MSFLITEMVREKKISNLGKRCATESLSNVSFLFLCLYVKERK